MNYYWESYGKIHDRERQDSLLNLELCPLGKFITLVPSVITYALSLHMTTERWRVCSIWNFSLEARALYACLLLLHILYLFSFCFLFSVSLYCFLGFEAQQDTGVTSSWHPQVKFIGRGRGGVPLAH
jgi:hypothetical protein